MNQQSLVKSYLELTEQLKELESKKEFLKTQIISLMDNGSDLLKKSPNAFSELFAGNYMVTSKITERTIFDSVKFKAECPELHAQYNNKKSYALDLKILDLAQDSKKAV